MTIKYRRTSSLDETRAQRDPPFSRLPPLGLPRRKTGAFTLVALACIVLVLGLMQSFRKDVRISPVRTEGVIVSIEAAGEGLLSFTVEFTLPGGRVVRGTKALPQDQAGHLQAGDRVAVLFDCPAEGEARVLDVGRVALPSAVR